MYHLGVVNFRERFSTLCFTMCSAWQPKCIKKRDTRIFQATVAKMSRNKDDRGDEDNADRCVTSHYCPS